MNTRKLDPIRAVHKPFTSNRPAVAVLRVVVVLAVVLTVVYTAPRADLLELTTWASYGLVAVSLVLVWGKGEIFSFAQTAFFGLGAYSYGAAALNLSSTTHESLSGVLIAGAVAAVGAAVVGYFIFYGQLKPLPIAVVTLAFSLVLFTAFSSLSDPSFRIGNAIFGGYNGMAVPALSVPGYPAGLDERLLFLVVALVVVGVVFLLLRLMKSSFGRVLLGTADNEIRSELLGYEPRKIRLQTFVIGGAIAGVGGGFYASTTLYIDPTIFGLGQAALVVVWVVVGGRTSLLGAVVGVVLVQKLNSELGGSGVGGDFAPIVLGIVLIVVVVALPGGIVPGLWKLFRRVLRLDRGEHAGAAPTLKGQIPVDLETVVGKQLTVSGLTKRFGGLIANDNLNMKFEPRSVNSIVGPNGAGKSTLFALLVGIHRPTAGTIHFGDLDMTKKPIYVRARAGFGIKRQVSSVFLGLTVLENLWIASFADTRNARAASERARQLAAWLGMTDSSDRPASELAHGHRQILEIAMVIAARPSVVLLDEPTAGMTKAETAQIAEIIHEIARHCCVVVVEHDMEFIRAMNSPITVMHRGAVLTSGTIDEIRADDRVLNVYLGRDHAAVE